MSNTLHINRNQLESPLEEIFIQQFEKFVNDRFEIIPQYEVRNSAGLFRLDFLLKSNDYMVAIELDGKEFHDEWRDEWRDAHMLGNGQVDCIYRFRGKDITTYINECIYSLYLNDHKLFDSRYTQVSKSLVDTEVFSYPGSEFRHLSDCIIYSIPTANEYGESTGRHHDIRMIRRCKNDSSQYWNKLFEFSQKHPEKKLDELIIQRNKDRKSDNGHFDSI
ncbi:hypothetical protein HX13_01610 [Chryseobacterium sp. P1-3]|uniref:hypothetical protein n=1 Tax=Chryseobacterium sp. (strain P1-3) TaxID=1517683 RepID=UPI0004E6698E|nr:hypothetical protein [Chryseobacterium sp. P1-3]KFF76064.1 hypothetical protein HX13_01610 [Chryseobacterium sp. P1-3]